jgi:hypothetical protein
MLRNVVVHARLQPKIGINARVLLGTLQEMGRQSQYGVLRQFELHTDFTYSCQTGGDIIT